MTAPLIVTAYLDQLSFETLNQLRQSYFPIALNQIPAHLTLFHALPGLEESGIIKALDKYCSSSKSFLLSSPIPLFLGRGMAFAYHSKELSMLHAQLAAEWQQWLTPQDRQSFKAHVTIQNKVTPQEARLLFNSFHHLPQPVCQIEGLILWRYLNGPWEKIRTFLFSDSNSKTVF